MYRKVPRSIRRFCKTVLPQLYGATDGRRILDFVGKVVATDRWNSFDRFHDTTETLVRLYKAAGARAEIHAAPTGGGIGSGRWIIHEAEDLLAATVDVVRPVRRRVLNYKRNPWHIIQWSSSTSGNGMTNELVIADTKEQFDRLSASSLAGKIMLTHLKPSDILKQLADKGAAGVICDHPVPKLPNAVAWTKFGWGGVSIENAAVRLVGLAISENQGKKLRGLAQKHGRLTLRTTVDIRKYVGSHDVVSGLIVGRDDPQDEVWGLAHSSEPGAHDNASGVAVCIEIAHVIEELIAGGLLPRPRRSIRLLLGYECYGFFHYLEHVRRFQAPLAGVCIDSVGARPQICGRRLEWHDTIPMSAGFVNRVGEAVVRATLALRNPGYRLSCERFVSTADTLIGDPGYGFPCPWFTTHMGPGKRPLNAYHSSADTLQILSSRGLATCAAAMAAYLYYLADAASPELLELASAETTWTIKRILAAGKKTSADQAAYHRDQHGITIERLQRWMWGGDRPQILSHLSACEDEVRRAAEKAGAGTKRPGKRIPAGGRRIPRRTAPLSPTLENTPASIAGRIRASKLAAWALFWADGRRNLAQIAQAVSCETGKEIAIEQIVGFFEAHADLGYVELVDPKDAVTRSELVADLKALGVERGMDLLVHSSLSRIGHVPGGTGTVIDALLAVIGKRGTLLLPSFNHGRAQVFNPMTTPTTNGAIPEAGWRRPEAVRSIHPTHSVAAIGPRAEQFCRNHLEVGVWAPESPIGQLIHGGGYILSIGVTHAVSTAYHVAEISMPCRCINQFGGKGYVVGPDGTVSRVRGLAFRSGSCPVPLSKLDETLDRRKLQRHGKVGHADATLVKAIDLWKVRREHLKDACPKCGVRPGSGV